MGSTCILTDGLVQFTQPGFSGREDVRVFPYAVQMGGEIYWEGEGLKTNKLPTFTSPQSPTRLVVPDSEKYELVFQNLAGKYREIIVILTSCELSPSYVCAEKASASVRGQAAITLIDSQTTSVGLGLLVQMAAEAAAEGVRGAEIERRVRKAVTQVYSLFCTAGLSYLSQEGFIDEGQAAIGEMLGLIPIFSLEEGKLSSIEKARNPRGVLDFFQEFLGEFEELQHIAFLQGASSFNHETHLLREHAQLHFPRTPFSEHTINLPVASLFGPRTLGLILLDSEKS
jgi:DegV family protein with EDD domain